jgi:hypothetical protein
VTQHTAELTATVQESSEQASTKWTFYLAESEEELEEGKAKEVGEGAIPPGAFPKEVRAPVSGLAPEKRYFVLLVLEAAGCPSPVEVTASFETVPRRPRVEAVSVVSVSATGARVRGVVIPDGTETTWKFEVEKSGDSEFEPVPGASGTIPQAEADEAPHQVEGELTGLTAGTSYRVRLVAENAFGPELAPGEATFETAGLPTAKTFPTVGVHGQGLRALGAVNAHGLTTQVHLEYVSEGSFAASGWTDATQLPALEVSGEFTGGEAFPSKIVGEDFGGLVPGEGYRFRFVAENEAGTATGDEQQLVMPTAQVGGVGPCTNEPFRAGLAENLLADCRAYEQVTPAEKHGTMDTDTYGVVVDTREVAEDGETVLMTAAGTQWLPSADSKNPTYAMRRTASGWGTSGLTPQPQAGATSYTPRLFDQSLSEVAIRADWKTTEVNFSPTVEFKVGPAGGPYETVATIPTQKRSEWAGASPDLAKLVLASEDRVLAGLGTGTTAGEDLYEWFAGAWRQLNVLSNGKTIGRCGASMADGVEGFQEEAAGSGATGGIVKGSEHSVARDHRRVFFEAVPGTNCAAQSDLFARVEGSAGLETIDMGPYRFLGADEDGTKVLVEGCTVGTLVEQCVGGSYVYRTVEPATGSVKTLFTTHDPVKAPTVSAGLGAFYFASKEQLAGAPPLAPASEGLAATARNEFRYDLSGDHLEFLMQDAPAETGGGRSVSADGRFYYFLDSGIGGLAGVGKPVNGQMPQQAFRYDAQTHVVECVSCASGFNPEPQLPATFRFGDSPQGNGIPDPTIASADGRMMFFDTTAALVPQDVDGEVPADGSEESHIPEFLRSPSSDTYEWRADGFDGCSSFAGCVSLISGGLGGYKTELIGTTPSGRDVFFATHESLVGQDTDTAGDIYDARIDGGFPGPAPPPAGCEGDACVSPPPAPEDTTPGSFGFSGPGNLAAPKSPATTPHKAAKRCRKGKVRRRGRCVRRHKRKSRALARHAAAVRRAR